MSRSFKHQPFQAICGGNSAKQDKVLAHRGERRAHTRALARAIREDRLEDYTPPLRNECFWNNTYSWGRDGKQHYCGLDGHDWFKHCASLDITIIDFWYGLKGKGSIWYGDPEYQCWPPMWYQKMLRK